LDHAIAKRSGGHNPQGALLFHVAIGLIIQEEKKAVFLDGPTNGTVKNIAIQKLRYVQFPALQLGRFQEIVGSTRRAKSGGGMYFCSLGLERLIAWLPDATGNTLAPIPHKAMLSW